MRIAIDANSLSYSRRTGIGRYCAAILCEFFRIAPDHEYYLYAAQPIDQRIKKEWSRYQNIFYRESNFPSRYLWQAVFLGGWLKKDNLDVYLAMDGLLPLQCKVPGVTIVADLIWYLFPQTVAPHIHWAFRLNLKRSVSKAYRCITISNATKHDLVNYAKIPFTKIDVVYLSAEERFKRQHEGEVAKILNDYNVRPPYIFFLGNLMVHKNLIGLIQAYKIFLNKAKNGSKEIPFLVIAGCRGWRSSKIFSTIKALNLAEHIQFLGYVKDEDLPELYSGAKLFVLPSLIEGFGLPILEAQACGTPVLCSRTSSMPEVADDAALYFDPYKAEDIAERLLMLYYDDALQRQFLAKGFENVKRFSWQKSAEQILHILEEASKER